MKGARRQKATEAKRTAKARRLAANQGRRGTSSYAIKKAYLHKMGLWGFEVPMSEKFWRKGA